MRLYLWQPAMPHSLLSRRLFLAALAAGTLAAPAHAQGPRRLAPQDESDVARVEQYLNGLKTLRARFLQINPSGATVEGTLYLSRPGRMRLDYDPPDPNLVIVNGSHLIHYDRALRTPAYLGLDATPAGLLVRETIKLAGDVTVTAVERGPAVLRVTLTQTKDPRAGKMTLVFGERPFQLNNWQVTDAQGLVTRVSLYEPQIGVALDPQLFVFREVTGFDTGPR